MVVYMNEAANDMGSRIQFAVDFAKKQGKAVQDLVAYVGITKTQLSRYTKSTNEPTVSRVARLAEFSGVDLIWLSTGEGHPMGSSPYVTIPFHEDSPEKSGPVKFERDYLEQVLRIEPDQCLMFTNTGDAMIGRGIMNGCQVLVDLRRQRGDDIYLITVNQDTMVRRLQFLPGNQVKVISDNDAYDDYTLPADDVIVVGRAAWIGGGR